MIDVNNIDFIINIVMTISSSSSSSIIIVSLGLGEHHHRRVREALLVQGGAAVAWTIEYNKI